MGFVLAVCMAILIDTVWCVPLVQTSGTKPSSSKEKVAEFATVHQQTQVNRRKRDAVDHVIFPETMEYDLEFRGQQTKLRLKRHEYLTPDIQLLDQNGPIKHDLAPGAPPCPRHTKWHKSATIGLKPSQETIESYKYGTIGPCRYTRYFKDRSSVYFLRKTGLYHDIEHHGSFVIQCEDATVHCGLRGSVVLDGHKWDIEPEAGSNKLHRLVSSTTTGTKIKFGADSPHIPGMEGSESRPKRHHNTGRQKRAIPTQCQIVECMAIVDESIWEFTMNQTLMNETAAEESIAAYYLALYTQADVHFNFINIRSDGSCMRLYLATVFIQKNTSESWSFPNEISLAGPRPDIAYVQAVEGLLECGAQIDDLKRTLGNLSVDLGQCFTRKDIVWDQFNGGREYFNFYRNLGFRGSCCDPEYSIYLGSIIEGYGDMVEVLIAHEIGSALGAFDDPAAGCFENDGYIMSFEVTINDDKLNYKNPWYFSQCSVDQMYSYIASQPSCLENHGFNGTQFAIFENQTLAGELYNLTEQCQVRFGFGSEFCDPTGQNRTFFDDMCGAGIFCTEVEFGDGSCTGVTRPFDGSPCGTFGSFCQFGECIIRKGLGENCTCHADCSAVKARCSYPDNFCRCADGFYDNDGNTTGGSCLEKVAVGQTCPQPDACLDPNAFCDNLNCTCLPGYYAENGSCFLLKCLGDACTDTYQCKGNDTECSGMPSTCRCPDDRYFNTSTGECDVKKDLGSSCEPGQCLVSESVCSFGICICQKGFFDTNGVLIDGGNCTAKLANGDACSQPDSCADPNANCSGTCQCLQDFYNNNGTCERRRCFGESCSVTSDCVSGGDLECIGTTCQCTNTSYFDGLTANCTTKKDLGSSCEPGQCLPANSVCGSVSGVCECQEGFFDDNGNVTSGGNCTLKLVLSTACSQPNSCADPNANCSGTCQCLQDFYNNNGTCERRRCFGEPCSSTSDCVNGGGLECIGGTCQCTNTSYFDGLNATCTAKKDLGSSCEPGQCLLGNAVCGSASGVCECQEGFFDDNGNMVAGGNCTLKLALNDSCSQPDSCADPNANCSGTCQCLQDFYNNAGTCERRRCFGESCSVTQDCVIGVGLGCFSNACQCTNTSYFDVLTGNCTLKKDLGSSCEPGQCLLGNAVCGSGSGVCECQEGFFDNNGNATAGGDCTSKLALTTACSQQDSCADPNAECIWSCICLQDFYNNNGTCERRRCFGESCSSTSDCVSGAALECIGSTCQCSNTTYFDVLTGNCTSKKDLGSSCEPGQCLLGNAVCGSASDVCECQEGFFDDNGNMVASGNCTLKLALNDSCSQPDSCADPNANCSGTCQCLQDFYNNAGTCERRRCFGESCSVTQDCVIGVGLGCISNTCQCTNTSYFDVLTGNCTSKKDLGSSCEPGQCLLGNAVCGSASGVCECQEGFFDNNGNATAGGDCTSKLALSTACSQQDSCADSNAECVWTCICLQDFYNNNGTCERRRCFGESCSSTPDCVSGASLECIGNTCQCSNTTYFDVLTGNCTSKLALGSSCTSNQQCVDLNAVCNPITSTCRCAEGFVANSSACIRGCPLGGWELFNNTCYYFGETELFNQASRDFCDRFDSDIYESSPVQVDTLGELTFLKEFMTNRALQPTNGYWNDLFQNTTNNVDEYWRTSGDPLIIADWGTGEPNDQAESCTVFYKPVTYQQADVSCTNPNRPTEADSLTAFALCEISLDDTMSSPPSMGPAP